MKHLKWFIIIPVLITAVAVIIWWFTAPSLTSLQKHASARFTPLVDISSINVTEINNERISMISKLTVISRFPSDINTRRINYEVYLDTIRLISEVYDKPIRIVSSDTTFIELPMTIPGPALNKALEFLGDRKTDSADYRLKADLIVTVPIAGQQQFTMQMTKRLPVLRTPEMKVKDVDVYFLNVSNPGVKMAVEVNNVNSFPVKIKDGNLLFTAGETLAMEGKMKQLVEVPGRSKKEFLIHASLTTGLSSGVALKLLKEKGSASYAYRFSCSLTSKNNLLKNSKLTLSKRGKIKDLINGSIR